MSKELNSTIATRISCRQSQLERVIKSDYPIDPRHAQSHERHVFNANLYLEELQEALSVVECGVNTRLVPKATFNRQLEKADFVEIEFDGYFCKVAVVTNYPGTNMWLIYMAPLEVL